MLTARTTALTRLRLAFAALALGLVLAVLGLLSSALSRLAVQRQLRQRMVAERVFDEVEREISGLLQHEAERPSAAYDATDTDPARWGRFIVGYFRRDPQLHVLAEQGLGAERAARVRNAVTRARAALDSGVGTATVPWLDVAADDVDEEDIGPIANRSRDVLRQLNRGVKVRQRRQQALARELIVARADDDTLVFERMRNGRHEGFVLSMSALVTTIQSWVLSAQGLDRVAVLRLADADRAAIARTSDEFSHQLAAPLSTQHVTLHLSQLDDEDAVGTLYGLGALLVVAAVVGLFALYRMVAVQIGFAERRNNFVAAVTHELRTPLTSIRMYGEMLRDGMVTDEAVRQEYYATITAEGERLTRLINNVMEHGQLRRGQRSVSLQRGDLRAVVREVLDVMKPHIVAEGFAVTEQLAEGLPLVEHDVDALKQALFNVIDNALKYGRGAQCRLDVSCEMAPGGHSVALRLRDWGAGVADEQLASVFEPFFRGEQELTRRHKGTGLGLALVRDLVTLMNGNVRAANAQPGFEITIMLRAVATTNAEVVTSAQ